VALPSTPESVPRPILRWKSICHNRSCAWTTPSAKNRSWASLASIVGMPWESRITSTGWCSPATLSVPLPCGSVLLFR